MKRLLIIPLLFINLILSATNYYVKNGGNDAADGESDGNAWETVTKVNSESFSGDDTIFFNRGDTWLTKLIFPSSGSAGQPIVVTSYGTGLSPKFTAQVNYTEWVNYSGDIYYCTGAYRTYYMLIIDGTWGIARETTIEGLDTDYEYYDKTTGTQGQTDDTMFVYLSTGSPTTAIGTYIDNMIALTGISYITFDNLHITYAGSNAFSVQDSSNFIEIKNCRIDWIGGTSIYFENGRDILIQKDTLENIGIDGAYMKFSKTYDISYNVITNTGQSFAGDLQSIGSWYSRYGTISYNIITHTGGGSTIEVSAAIGAGYHCDDINIFNNYMYTTTTDHAVLSLFSGDFDIYNNIIINTGGAIEKFIATGEYSESYTIINAFNNVLIDVGVGVQVLTNAAVSGNSLITIKNNIFYNIGDLYHRVSTELLPYYISNYNLYLNDTGTKFKIEGTEYNLTDWQTASSQDANSVVGDPLFTSEFDDLTLQVGSPAIAAGIGVGILKDYNGDYHNDPPDIGAIAYDAGTPSPPELPQVTTTVTHYYSTGITVSGTDIDDGGGTVSAKGMCWDTGVNPTTGDNIVPAGSGTANFSATIRGLVKSTTYHVRTYVTNETGTTYGADKEVTTYSQSIALDDSGNVMVDDDGNIIIIN